MRSSPSFGFTLVEAVIVIAITGILAAVSGHFIKDAIDSYTAVQRRAELADTADGALRRMAQGLHTAMPNSLRQPSDQCVEFMPTVGSGRYRETLSSIGTDVPAPAVQDKLDFTTTDSSFHMLGGPFSSGHVAANDVLVVNNSGSGANDAYTGGNAIQIANVVSINPNTTRVEFVGSGSFFGSKTLPSSSPTKRFYTLHSSAHVMAYVCRNVGEANGTGTGELWQLRRTLSSSYSMPTSCPMPGTPWTAGLLAQHVSQCSIKVIGSQLVSMTLTLKREGEAVQLYHQVFNPHKP